MNSQSEIPSLRPKHAASDISRAFFMFLTMTLGISGMAYFALMFETAESIVLLNQRTNGVLISGFLFLAGVILSRRS
jgi:hypothetical protein